MISKGGVQQPTFGELCDAVDLLMLPQLGHHTAPLHHPLTAPLQACSSSNNIIFFVYFFFWPQVEVPSSTLRFYSITQ